MVRSSLRLENYNCCAPVRLVSSLPAVNQRHLLKAGAILPLLALISAKCFVLHYINHGKNLLAEIEI